MYCIAAKVFKTVGRRLAMQIICVFKTKHRKWLNIVLLVVIFDSDVIKTSHKIDWVEKATKFVCELVIVARIIINF